MRFSPFHLIVELAIVCVPEDVKGHFSNKGLSFAVLAGLAMRSRLH